MKKLKLKLFKQWGFNFMLWLAIVASVLLFMPKSLLQVVFLEAVVTEYLHFIGLSFIVGVAYFLTQVLNYFLNEAITYLKGKRMAEVIEEKVRLLDPTERALLREFFLQGETILTLPEEEIAVKSLLVTNIIENMGNQKHYAIQGSTADYKISMRARLYLNRQVLRLPTGEPSMAEMQNLINARPNFVNNIISPRKHAA